MFSDQSSTAECYSQNNQAVAINLHISHRFTFKLVLINLSHLHINWSLIRSRTKKHVADFSAVYGNNRWGLLSVWSYPVSNEIVQLCRCTVDQKSKL